MICTDIHASSFFVFKWKDAQLYFFEMYVNMQIQNVSLYRVLIEILSSFSFSQSASHLDSLIKMNQPFWMAASSGGLPRCRLVSYSCVTCHMTRHHCPGCAASLLISTQAAHISQSGPCGKKKGDATVIFWEAGKRNGV